MNPRPVKREMLIGLLDLRVPEIELDFDAALKIAQNSARPALANPMLLAWFDTKAWKHSPAIC
jgi:hypothetical protein